MDKETGKSRRENMESPLKEILKSKQNTVVEWPSHSLSERVSHTPSSLSFLWSYFAGKAQGTTADAGITPAFEISNSFCWCIKYFLLTDSIKTPNQAEKLDFSPTTYYKREKEAISW